MTAASARFHISSLQLRAPRFRAPVIDARVTPTIASSASAPVATPRAPSGSSEYQ